MVTRAIMCGMQAGLDDRQTARHRQSPGRLLGRAAGLPWLWPGKAGRLLAALWQYADTRELRRKLTLLHRRGVIADIPNRWQLLVGSYDMMRFWIDPAAADYYRRSDLDYGFHQILRFLDEPASLTDPVGLLSSRDAIIGHVLQVVHANPAYDMALLAMFEDGLEQLECQTQSVIEGTHPRARSINAIVEEVSYHHNLLNYVRELRSTGRAAPPVRENILSNPHFAELERVFGTLSGSMRYFCTLPTDWHRALRHVYRVTEFAGHLDEFQRRALVTGQPILAPD